jgi:6,7-dimethyl-8-ribityllumazine synthase
VSDKLSEHDEGRPAPYDHTRWDDDGDDTGLAGDDIDEARENVLDAWPVAAETDAGVPEPAEPSEPSIPARDEPAGLEPPDELPAPELPPGEQDAGLEVESLHVSTEADQHAPGELVVPPGYAVLEGEPNGARRAVGVVVSRFNGEVTSRLLDSALEELERAGVSREAITVMPVPGAFELPLAAMALAKTRRFACVVALGCVIRGETPHFDYVAGEAASGLQLAALETGVPVAFGLLTVESQAQADARVEKGAEAVRTGLEMADAFANLRAAAAV